MKLELTATLLQRTPLLKISISDGLFIWLSLFSEIHETVTWTLCKMAKYWTSSFWVVFLCRIRTQDVLEAIDVYFGKRVHLFSAIHINTQLNKPLKYFMNEREKGLTWLLQPLYSMLTNWLRLLQLKDHNTFITLHKNIM